MHPCHPSCICRLSSMKTKTSKVIILSAAATVLSSTPTSGAATLFTWRVGPGSCMRGPITWVTSTFWPRETTPTTNTGRDTMIAWGPVGSYEMWVQFYFSPTTSSIYVRFGFQSVSMPNDQQRLPWTWTLIFVSQISSVFRICVYERPDFSGQMLESTEDMSDLADHWHRHEVHSAQVLDGAWVFYELPDFHGQQYLLEEGEYRRFTEWAAMNPKVGSFRSVV